MTTQHSAIARKATPEPWMHAALFALVGKEKVWASEMKFIERLIARWPSLGAVFIAGALASCSVHPIPDDVSLYSTEEIVRNVRCEAKDAVRERIQIALLERGLGSIDPERVLADKRNLEIIRRTDPALAKKFQAYGASTIAYRFEFDIIEDNNNNGSVTLAAPFTNGQFSLALGGTLNKEREGHRTFTTVESFEKLVNLNCTNWMQPGRNIVYPLTGSIGMRRIINTFIDVAELRGGKEQFTDDIRFTTLVRGKVNPTLELVPVINRFQVINADVSHESKRNDMHNVKVSLAFPSGKDWEAAREMGGGSMADVAFLTKQRALINICIAEGEAREDRFKTLREISPRDYCRRNGEFAPW